jgi:hypothetical protein
MEAQPGMAAPPCWRLFGSLDIFLARMAAIAYRDSGRGDLDYGFL